MPIINRLKSSVTLKIVNPAGKRDSINIQPQGRVTLPVGWRIDPAYAKEYESITINTDATGGK